jgi:hypothetical protein
VVPPRRWPPRRARSAGLAGSRGLRRRRGPSRGLRTLAWPRTHMRARRGPAPGRARRGSRTSAWPPHTHARPSHSPRHLGVPAEAPHLGVAPHTHPRPSHGPRTWMRLRPQVPAARHRVDTGCGGRDLSGGRSYGPAWEGNRAVAATSQGDARTVPPGKETGRWPRPTSRGRLSAPRGLAGPRPRLRTEVGPYPASVSAVNGTRNLSRCRQVTIEQFPIMSRRSQWWGRVRGLGL